jgi:hypothetical protein
MPIDEDVLEEYGGSGGSGHDPTPHEASAHPPPITTDKIALQAHDQSFVSSQKKDPLYANRPGINTWEIFTVVDTHDGTIALQNHFGNYAQLQPGGGIDATSDRPDDIGCQFQVHDRGGQNVTLRVRDRYVSAREDDAGRVATVNSDPAAWEVFHVIGLIP